LSDFELKVYLRVLIHLQGDAGTDAALETLKLSNDLILSNRQSRSGVEAAFIGLGLERCVGAYVADFDSRARNDGVLGVRNCPRNRSGLDLGG